MHREWTNTVEKWIRAEFRDNMYNKKIITSLSQSPYLPLDIVLHYPHLSWDYNSIRKHPGVNTTFIKKLDQKLHRRLVPIRPRLWPTPLFQSTPVDFRRYEKHPYRPWKMSCHPLLPIPIVLANPLQNWDYGFLLRHRKWTVHQLEILSKQRRVDWRMLSKNYYITPDLVREFLSYPWDWKHLASHPAFPPQDIYEDRILFLRWKWNLVYMNPRITVSFWSKIRQGLPFRETFHTPYILMNHFGLSVDLIHYATVVINQFIYHYWMRRRITEKLLLLRKLRIHMPYDVLLTIVDFL